MTRVGIVLSGCGFQDGAEIQETVLAMLALEQAGASLSFFAPAVAQAVVVDHLTGQPKAGSRQVLEESARICRGQVRDLERADARELDALVLPGGFGAAQNLCDFATQGEKMTVNPTLEHLLRALHEGRKPIGAICIAPVILAKVFGPFEPRLTIGHEAAVAAKVTSLGARHVDCAVDDIVIDLENRLVTTPAYMLGESIRDINPGVAKLATALVHMAKGH